MDDPLLLNRAIAGDLDSLGQLFDSYFGRIYDLAWRMLRDADAAGAATEAVFRETAANLTSAAKASSFEAWLFSLAHARLLARVQPDGWESSARPQHEEAFGAFEAPDPCRLDAPQPASIDGELPCQVWEAAASLSPRDYSLLDLHLRQHLDPRDLAPILGGSRGNATVMMQRLERAAGEVMATYVLARRGPAECEQLRQIVSAEAFPPLTNELRTQIDGHAASCDVCRRTRVLPVPPLEIFAALAPVAAPFVLKGEVWRALVAEAPVADDELPIGVPLPLTVSAASAPAYATTNMPALDSFGGAGGSGGSGYDGPGGTGFLGDDSRRNVLLFAGAAAGMLLVAFVAGGFALKAFGSGGGGGGSSTTATRTASAGSATRTTVTPGVVIDTPTPATATATPLPTDTPPPPPPPDTPTPPPPPPTPTTVPPTRTPPRQVSPTPLKPTATPTKKPAR